MAHPMCSSKRGRGSSGDPRGRPVAGAGAHHRTTPPRGRPHDKCLPCCPPWPRLSTDSQNTERHKHPQSSATCGAQPDRAKRGSPSERSEVPPPPTTSEASRCPRASRGPQTKAGMRLDWKRTNTERINILRSAGKRALHVRDIDENDPHIIPYR